MVVKLSRRGAAEKALVRIHRVATREAGDSTDASRPGLYLEHGQPAGKQGGGAGSRASASLPKGKDLDPDWSMPRHATAAAHKGPASTPAAKLARPLPRTHSAGRQPSVPRSAPALGPGASGCKPAPARAGPGLPHAAGTPAGDTTAGEPASSDVQGLVGALAPKSAPAAGTGAQQAGDSPDGCAAAQPASPAVQGSVALAVPATAPPAGVRPRIRIRIKLPSAPGRSMPAGVAHLAASPAPASTPAAPALPASRRRKPHAALGFPPGGGLAQQAAGLGAGTSTPATDAQLAKENRGTTMTPPGRKPLQQDASQQAATSPLQTRQARTATHALRMLSVSPLPGSRLHEI